MADFGSHEPAIAFERTNGDGLARSEIGKPGCAQNLDMQKNVVGTPENVGKTESLGLVEPFHPGGQQRRPLDLFLANAFEILEHGALRYRRLDAEHLHRLHAARRSLDGNDHPGAIGDRALAVVAQHICMQQDVRPALVGDHEAESTAWIEPLHDAGKAPRFLKVRHVENSTPVLLIRISILNTPLTGA